ncbi:RNA 3'-terminal phosphate cyclase [Rubripirellula obstinata]|uniref:RNA 3'-terminal phosphate cyclase n=1 Tax=Rubripirellula obstinata TaxID=406547 RepID=A0A5B1CN72_9BACT|nr:RNA 3'-terminal phosphate cyclase [Rubripirellula obstinata]KAA1261812.1 RNA 3'-terminal phosphate cyclase [Rubripirellula obstinata]
MIEIDGSEGEGGGQIVRSSLALAAVTETSVRITNIRAGRKKPGLLRQHLTGVRAISEICDGHVVGGDLGSQELTFAPSAIRGGDFSFQVGTAGSAILVAQTVLPALMMARESSTVRIQGGTHAAWAPPFDFFDRCYLSQLVKMNASVTALLDAYGFYPAGGGEIELKVTPTPQLTGLQLLNREGELQPKVIAVVAKVPTSIGQRECDVIRRKADWPTDACHIIEAQRSGGPGNVVMIECGFDNVTELMVGFGKVGVKAEQVARSTLRQARTYLAANVPVGEYLADQLLLPMGIAASQGEPSEFRTVPLSQHSQTHINVLKRFLDISIVTKDRDDGSVHVRISATK